jgi:hypothetical protein
MKPARPPQLDFSVSGRRLGRRAFQPSLIERYAYRLLRPLLFARPKPVEPKQFRIVEVCHRGRRRLLIPKFSQLDSPLLSEKGQQFRLTDASAGAGGGAAHLM